MEYKRYMQCRNKKRYTSYKSAEKTIEQISKKRREPVANWNIYQCRFCHFLHIGYTNTVLRLIEQERKELEWIIK